MARIRCWRDQPGQVRGGAERAAVDLGQAEGGVVAGHDDVGVADQADAAAEAEAVHRGDHRDGALVDRRERRVAAAVGADQRVEAGGALHLLDVDAGVEPAPLGRAARRRGRESSDRRSSTASARSNQPCDRQRVDRREVDDDLGNRTVPVDARYPHGRHRPSRTKRLLGSVPARAPSAPSTVRLRWCWSPAGSEASASASPRRSWRPAPTSSCAPATAGHFRRSTPPDTHRELRRGDVRDPEQRPAWWSTASSSGTAGWTSLVNNAGGSPVPDCGHRIAPRLDAEGRRNSTCWPRCTSSQRGQRGDAGAGAAARSS